MKLTYLGIKDIEFVNKGYKMPTYDISRVSQDTKDAPIWLHFGAGNIFRAFLAAKQQALLDSGLSKKGIIVVETFDEEIIDKAFVPFDNLTLNISLSGNGDIEKTVIASIVESIKYSTNYERLVEVAKAKSLQIISFTITEKGYALKSTDDTFFPYIAKDMLNFNKPSTTIGILTKLLYERFMDSKTPIALVSLDNCSHNGTLLHSAVTEFAKVWQLNGFVTNEFIEYINDSSKVAFNWSMIDKITPRPSEIIEDILTKDGFTGGKIVTTAKNTYVSSFVNAEESEYLAIEDNFPNGRPMLEKTGVMFADRDTIDKIEKMKVCTCLNPLHTSLAIFGCLLNFKSISSEMKDNTLKTLIEKIGYLEGMPVVVDPKIMSASKFIDECINKRFPNPFVPDTPQRIATDTSKKLPVRFGETLKAYIAKGKTDLSFLTYIPLVFAGWARYIMAVDDELNSFELSPDPNLSEFTSYLKNIKVGENNNYDCLKNIFSSKEIFGIDLYEYNLGIKTENLFKEMVEGKGAVRNTLNKYLFDNK